MERKGRRLHAHTLIPSALRTGEGFIVPDAKVKRSCLTAGLCVKPHVPQTRAQIRGHPLSAASLFAFWEKANNNVPAVLDS